MQKATISQLKNRLSEYLKKVRAGETILVLDRDEPIARIERVDPATITEDRMARLEKAGLARRARRPFQPEFLDEAPATAKQSVLDALLEERRDGR